MKLPKQLPTDICLSCIQVLNEQLAELDTLRRQGKIDAPVHQFRRLKIADKITFYKFSMKREDRGLI